MPGVWRNWLICLAVFILNRPMILGNVIFRRCFLYSSMLGQFTNRPIGTNGMMGPLAVPFVSFFGNGGIGFWDSFMVGDFRCGGDVHCGDGIRCWDDIRCGGDS